MIDRCIETLWQTGADSVISVKETRGCFGTLTEGRFEYLIKGQRRPRQERSPLYEESSTVYVTRTEALLKHKSVLGERLYAVVVDEDEAIDINTPLDFVIAEAVMRWKSEASGGHVRAD
jgi:N-acylneuraminate cytidylyltransferase